MQCVVHRYPYRSLAKMQAMKDVWCMSSRVGGSATRLPRLEHSAVDAGVAVRCAEAQLCPAAARLHGGERRGQRCWGAAAGAAAGVRAACHGGTEWWADHWARPSPPPVTTCSVFSAHPSTSTPPFAVSALADPPTDLFSTAHMRPQSMRQHPRH